MEIQNLPEKIIQKAHWRVNYRPSIYEKERISNSKAAFDLVRKSLVHRRGWNYPYVSEDNVEQIREMEYVASGCDWGGFVEYWRLYYSGQFVHLFAPRENVMYDKPEYIDIPNTLYNIAEVIEFAARLTEKGIYQDSLQISIQIKNIMGFKLAAKSGRWRGNYSATRNVIGREFEVNTRELLAQTAHIALDTTINILGEFGWDNPPRDILANYLKKFLTGK